MVHRQSRIVLLLLVLGIIFVLQSSKVTADDSVGFLQYEGKDYTIEIEFTKNANIPDGAFLKVAEIIEGTQEYEEYYMKIKESLSEDSINYVRLFDITIMYGEEEIEPESSVNVLIKYDQGIEKKNKVN